jgi:hypothetical protein
MYPVQRVTSATWNQHYDGNEELTPEEKAFVSELETAMKKDDEEEPRKTSKKYGFWARAQDFGPWTFFTYWEYVSKYYISAAARPHYPRAAVVSFLFYYNLLTFNVTNKASRGLYRSLGNDPRAYGLRKNLWERLSAVNQCRFIDPPTPSTRCWLCGFGQADFPLKDIKGKADWQCEHILPLCAALLFFDVPQSINDTLVGYNYALNYGWAHAECNRLKSSYSFSELFEDSSKNGKLLNTPRTNIDFIHAYILDLGLLLKLKSKQSRYNDWIRTRVDYIEIICNNLSNHISELYNKESKTIFPEFNIRDSRIQRTFGNIDHAFRLAYESDIQDIEVKQAIDKQRIQVLTLNPEVSIYNENVKKIVAELPRGLLPEKLEKDIEELWKKQPVGGYKHKSRRTRKKRTTYRKRRKS